MITIAVIDIIITYRDRKDKDRTSNEESNGSNLFVGENIDKGLPRPLFMSPCGHLY